MYFNLCFLWCYLNCHFKNRLCVLLDNWSPTLYKLHGFRTQRMRHTYLDSSLLRWRSVSPGSTGEVLPYKDVPCRADRMHFFIGDLTFRVSPVGSSNPGETDLLLPGHCSLTLTLQANSVDLPRWVQVTMSNGGGGMQHRQSVNAQAAAWYVTNAKGKENEVDHCPLSFKLFSPWILGSWIQIQNQNQIQKDYNLKLKPTDRRSRIWLKNLKTKT